MVRRKRRAAKPRLVVVPPPRFLDLHGSHRLQVHRGLTFCTECGYSAVKKAVNVKAPCRTRVFRNSQGKQNLVRIASDRLPAGVKAWPEKGP